MKHYDEQLQQLQRDIARSKQLGPMAERLQEQKNILQSRVYRLEQIMIQEDADVKRLEGKSLTALFLRVTGKLGEKLDAEQREAWAARLKYETEARELEDVRQELDRCRQELASLRGSQQRYEAVFREKQAAVRTSGGPEAERLLSLEESLSALTVREKELSEAVQAGNAALQTAQQILTCLDSAKSWGTFDLVGGGLVSDLAKHSHLDDAQALVHRLQGQLRRFHTELSDVQLPVNPQINVEGFLRFADFFFDGLLADWAVLDQISSARDQVTVTMGRIEAALRPMKPLLDKVQAQRNQVLSGIQALVLEAQ